VAAAPRMPHLRLRRLVLVVVSLALAAGTGIAGFEIAGRFTEYRYLLAKTEFPDGYFRADAELGADHAPNMPPAVFKIRGPQFDIFTNWVGCFDRDQTIEPNYILAVGDSATWGFVPADKNWTRVLELLAGRQVLNCGVSGVGTRFALTKARRVIEQIGFPPSLIILLHIDNDLNDDYLFPSYTVIDGQRVDRLKSLNLVTGTISQFSDAELESSLHAYRLGGASLKERIKQNSLTAWLLYWLFATGVDRKAGGSLLSSRYAVDFWDLDFDAHPWVRGAIEDHLQAFREFRRMAAGYGTRLILFEARAGETEPTPHRREFSHRLRTELEWVHSITLERMGVASATDIRHRFDDHWNENGNRLAAKVMHEYLRAAGLL
jgi:hypothetical protein